MKLYDFQCNGCGRRFEDLVHDVAEARCPSCSSSDVAKQLSTFAVGGGRSERPSATAAACGPCCGGGACGLD
jgi:putative FmdB family regulatory protein